MFHDDVCEIDEPSSNAVGHFTGFEKVSVNGRDVRFVGEVSNSTMGQLIRCLNEAAKHAGDLNYINLYISTYGGSAHAMFMAIEHMNTMKKEGLKIHTHAVGMCMSAGTFLFLAGDARFVYSTTAFMVHDARGVLWGNTQEIEAQLTEWNILQEQLRFYIHVRTGLPFKTIAELFDRDTYLHPRDVQKLRYSTEIVDLCGILPEIAPEKVKKERKTVKTTKNTPKKTEKRTTKTTRKAGGK